MVGRRSDAGDEVVVDGERRVPGLDALVQMEGRIFTEAFPHSARLPQPCRNVNGQISGAASSFGTA